MFSRYIHTYVICTYSQVKYLIFRKMIYYNLQRLSPVLKTLVITHVLKLLVKCLLGVSHICKLYWEKPIMYKFTRTWTAQITNTLHYVILIFEGWSLLRFARIQYTCLAHSYSYVCGYFTTKPFC